VLRPPGFRFLANPLYPGRSFSRIYFGQEWYSLCHEIKTSDKFHELRNTPIIFISAVKEKAGSRLTFDPSEQGLEGPDDYIDKPPQPEDLFNRIERLLKKIKL